MNKLYNKILKYYFLYNLFVIASIAIAEIILFIVNSDFLIIFFCQLLFLLLSLIDYIGVLVFGGFLSKSCDTMRIPIITMTAKLAPIAYINSNE